MQCISGINKLWIRKSKGCNKYIKFLSSGSLREYSRRAQPATIISEKATEDLIELEVTSDKQRDIAVNKPSSVSLSSLPISTEEEKEKSPIVFIRKNCQFLDLGRLPEANEDKLLRNVYVKDVERLINLYSHSNSLKTQANNQLTASVDVAPLKLVNAISPKELEWKEQTVDLSKLGKYYMKLSKIRLTGLVVLTTLGGYVMAPGTFNFSTLALTCLGTGLTSASANSINQFFEVPFDSQMSRTKNRVLVRGFLTPLHVVTFAGVCAASGVTILTFGANQLTAILGASNLVLYTLVYTPMKRYSILNTWVGSIVGAIPPVMGWVACTGSVDWGALLLGAVLFAWQFPHFNALSWNLRGDYSRGGYRMMSVTSPDLCRRTALRYSILLIPLCTAAPLADVTTWMFAADSLPVNLYFTYLAWKFYQNADSASSRKLFRASLLYLPVIMTLLAISKKPNEKKKNELDENGNYLIDSKLNS